MPDALQIGQRHDRLAVTLELVQRKAVVSHKFWEQTDTFHCPLLPPQIGQRHDCLAVTLELPFKDTIAAPENEQGWSPERSMRLGGAMLDAILAVVPQLRS
jgi:hypothetical protein